MFEGVNFSFLAYLGDGGFENRTMGDGSFGDAICAFTTENALVTWDPLADEFDSR